jgi:hypothetical protein
MTNLTLLATDDLDKTILVTVDGTRYEYWIRGNYDGIKRLVVQKLRRKAYGQALNLLKSNAWKVNDTPLAQNFGRGMVKGGG